MYNSFLTQKVKFRFDSTTKYKLQLHENAKKFFKKIILLLFYYIPSYNDDIKYVYKVSYLVYNYKNIVQLLFYSVPMSSYVEFHSLKVSTIIFNNL